MPPAPPAGASPLHTQHGSPVRSQEAGPLKKHKNEQEQDRDHDHQHQQHQQQGGGQKQEKQEKTSPLTDEKQTGNKQFSPRHQKQQQKKQTTAAAAATPMDEDTDKNTHLPINHAIVTEASSGHLRFTAALAAPDLTNFETARVEYASTKEVTNWVQDSRGYSWRLLYFPYGNNLSSSEGKPSCSLYLEINPKNEEHLDGYCRRFVAFRLNARRRGKTAEEIAVLPEEERMAGQRNEKFEYTGKGTDWGFPRFLPVHFMQKDPAAFVFPVGAEEKRDKDKEEEGEEGEEEGGEERTGKIIIDAIIDELPGFRDADNYDSKKETGMVGLRNQGATCYMNSLLQFLWSVRSLRKAVYDMPTEEEDKTKSVALALQRVFFRLQTGEKPVSTKELTKAFGWDTYDSFIQHDVQELNRVLCDKLEEKMKGTLVENTIKKLFAGVTRPTTRCLHVDFQSSREEEFYDVQLDVKGCKTLLDSLNSFIRPETMTGANKYEADGHGKQDAERFTVFTQYPPVMTIHLKRFEYNFHTNAMTKVNQKFEFPTRVDLAPYLGEEERAKQGGEVMYRLHSVLVHSGDVHAGHYYAYIRQADTLTETDTQTREGKGEGEDGWYKYDDDMVTKVTEAEMLEDGFGSCPIEEILMGARRSATAAAGGGSNGGGQQTLGGAAGGLIKPLISKATSSAYMLVYVREESWPTIMRPLADTDISPYLKERFKREKEEMERKARENREGHLYLNVNLVRESDVRRFRRYTFKEDFAKMQSKVLPVGGGVGTSTSTAFGGAITSTFTSTQTQAGGGGGGGGGREGGGEGGEEDAKPLVIKIKKAEPIAAIMLHVREKMGIPLHRQRLWGLAVRQNCTTRVECLLTMPTPEEEAEEAEEMKKATSLTEAGAGKRWLRSQAKSLPDENASIAYVYVEDVEETERFSGLVGGILGGKEEEEKKGEEGGGGAMQVVVEEEGQVGAGGGGGRKKRGAGAGAGIDGSASKRSKVGQAAAGEGVGVSKTKNLTTTCQGAAVAGERVQTMDELIDYLNAYPPLLVPKDSVFLFFKAYRPELLDNANTNNEAMNVEDSNTLTITHTRTHTQPPLEYLFSAHMPRHLTMQQVLHRLRPHLPWLPSNDEEVEIYEEVTPLKVLPMALDCTLDNGEIVHGDVLILQRKPPLTYTATITAFGKAIEKEQAAAEKERGEGEEGDNDEDSVVTMDDPEHFSCYNSASLPPRVPSYFRYLVEKRIFRMRPYGALEEELLQKCAERGSITEIPGKVGLIMKEEATNTNTHTPKVKELLLETSCSWSYHMYQHVLGQFLSSAPTPSDTDTDTTTSTISFSFPFPFPSSALRFHSRDPYHDAPAKTIRSLPNKDALFATSNYNLTYYFFSTRGGDPSPHKEEVLYFELMPFPLIEMDEGVVRDVVINDARLRRLVRLKLESEGVCVGVGGGGLLPRWVKASCESFKAVWTGFVEEGAAERGGGGKKEKEVVNVEEDETQEKEKEKETKTYEPLILSVLVPKEGTAADLLKAISEVLGEDTHTHTDTQNLEYELLDAREGKVKGVWAEEKGVTAMPDSALTAKGGLVGPLASARRVVLQVLDPVEKSTIASTTTAEAEAAAEDEDKEEEEEEELLSLPNINALRSLSLQVNFLADGPRPVAGEKPLNVPVITCASGLPFLTCVVEGDTWETLLARIGAKAGVSVEVLKTWTPALEEDGKLYYLSPSTGPGHKEEEGEKEGEKRDGEGEEETTTGSHPPSKDCCFYEDLLAVPSPAIMPHLVTSPYAPGYDPMAFESLPAITFLTAGPVGVCVNNNGGRVDLGKRRPRRTEGIRIREET